MLWVPRRTLRVSCGIAAQRSRLRRASAVRGEPAASTLGIQAQTYRVVAVDELGMLARRAVDAREIWPDVGQVHVCLSLHLDNVWRLGAGCHRPNVSPAPAA